MEGLSRACVQAIAARAGLNLSIREFDYGIDGTFHEVALLPGRRVETGRCLNFQLKASTRWQLIETEEKIAYDLEAKTYNDLVERQQGVLPCLLILLILPRDRTQ